ncbi:MAG: GNAT family N-acetyltransferase [Syntrophomonadaceae bacterium]|nr:GNAT family N-acetyltransferase [Syntrophomonadaceae bacterium]
MTVLKGNLDNKSPQIQRILPDDIEALQDFWKSVPGVGLGRGDDSESLRLFINKNPSSCLMIKGNHQIIGTVLGGFDGRRGYIYHLAVHPERRRRGLGKLLLEKVGLELKRLGVGKIHLFVLDENANGIEFYEHIGWTRRKDIQVMSYNLNN